MKMREKSAHIISQNYQVEACFLEVLLKLDRAHKFCWHMLRPWNRQIIGFPFSMEFFFCVDSLSSDRWCCLLQRDAKIVCWIIAFPHAWKIDLNAFVVTSCRQKTDTEKLYGLPAFNETMKNDFAIVSGWLKIAKIVNSARMLINLKEVCQKPRLGQWFFLWDCVFLAKTFPLLGSEVVTMHWSFSVMRDTCKIIELSFECICRKKSDSPARARLVSLMN